jgi:hypothetical protein
VGKFAAIIASNSACSKAGSAQIKSTNSPAADVGVVVSGILDHSPVGLHPEWLLVRVDPNSLRSRCLIFIAHVRVNVKFT